MKINSKLGKIKSEPAPGLVSSSVKSLVVTLSLHSCSLQSRREFTANVNGAETSRSQGATCFWKNYRIYFCKLVEAFCLFLLQIPMSHISWPAGLAVGILDVVNGKGKIEGPFCII